MNRSIESTRATNTILLKFDSSNSVVTGAARGPMSNFTGLKR